MGTGARRSGRRPLSPRRLWMATSDKEGVPSLFLEVVLLFHYVLLLLLFFINRQRRTCQGQKVKRSREAHCIHCIRRGLSILFPSVGRSDCSFPRSSITRSLTHSLTLSLPHSFSLLKKLQLPPFPPASQRASSLSPSLPSFLQLQLYPLA